MRTLLHFGGIARWLMPADMEREPRFQTELFRLSRTGLRALGAMELGIALFPLHIGVLFSIRFWVVAAVSTATLVTASAKGIRMHVRGVAVISGLLTAIALMETALWLGLNDHLLFGELALVLFAVIAAVPLIPLETCALGSAIGVIYGITAPFAGAWDDALQTFIIFLTCFATAVSALLYAQKRAAFETHQQALAMQETLTAAQSRAQVAETAMSLGRLAAALTHEINTPLGAMKSAVDTLLLVSARQKDAGPEESARLASAQADLNRSIRDSADRLSAVVSRLKRLVALERDDKQPVKVNDLLSDVRLLLKDKIRDGVSVNWRLDGAHVVACSTSQLTTVFSNLLNNALTAVDGAGEIDVTTSRNNGLVEISIHDNGPGMDPEDVATIFDPGFKVQHGRVLGGNWSLFTARQIVNEHGGDIWIESEKGQGTTARVSLPVLNG